MISPNCTTNFISDRSYKTPLKPSSQFCKACQQNIVVESRDSLFVQFWKFPVNVNEGYVPTTNTQERIVLAILYVNLALQAKGQKGVCLYLFTIKSH